MQPTFCFQARGGRIADLLYLNQYSDTFTGISGNGPGDDPVIVHFVSSGYLRLEGFRGGAYMVRPGQVVFKDTSKPWRVWSGPGTRMRVLIVPRDHFSGIFARMAKAPEIVISNAGAADARLLSAFLDLAPRFDDASFAHLGRNAGQEVGIQLVSALIGVATFRELAVHSTVTLQAARLFIDAHLTDPELSPAMVASNLHISVRTLHRAFSDVDDSVMAYVRRQRLRGAKAALAVPGVRVVEVAARWQFSNSSHFIRNFKAAYGVSPASYAKSTHAE
jgi:AraC-like DNA-binding protein